MSDAAVLEQPSTVISPDQNDGLGGGAPKTIEDDKPESLRDAIKGAVQADKEAKTEVEEAPKEEKAAKVEEKPDDKAKVDDKVKEEVNPDAKAEVKEEVKDAEKADDKPVEEPKAEQPKDGKANRDAAPDSFHPDAKEVWANTPRAVRRDLHNYIEQSTAQLEQAKQATERYEQVKDFDDYLQQNGGSLRESLTRVAHMETLLQQNPLAGINEILQNAGPRKPDGSPVTLMELAQVVVNMGEQGYNQAMSQAQQQSAAMQPNPQDQQIQALQDQIAQMQQQQVASSVIEPFKAAHPRYDELKNDIAFFLKSGKVSPNLSPVERLEVAYDMAERINSISAPQEVPQASASEDRTPSFDGSKSVKSSPGVVSEIDPTPEDGSIRDLLRSNLKKAKRS